MHFALALFGWEDTRDYNDFDVFRVIGKGGGLWAFYLPSSSNSDDCSGGVTGKRGRRVSYPCEDFFLLDKEFVNT